MKKPDYKRLLLYCAAAVLALCALWPQASANVIFAALCQLALMNFAALSYMRAVFASEDFAAACEAANTPKSPAASEAEPAANEADSTPKSPLIPFAKAFFAPLRFLLYFAYALGFWLLVRYFGFYAVEFFSTCFIITVIFIIEGIRCLRR